MPVLTHRLIEQGKTISQEALDAMKQRLREKLKRRDERAKEQKNTLRDNRPGPPPERCADVTEQIQCFRSNYWLCPKCLAFHQGIEARAVILEPAQRREAKRRRSLVAPE